MSLREKLSAQQTDSPAAAPQTVQREAYKQLKEEMHRKLVDQFDLAALEGLPADKLRQEIATSIDRLLLDEQAPVSAIERRMLVRDIQHEMLGFGPLELLMADPTVADILVNAYDKIYVERRGRLELTDVTFSDDRHLMRIIDKIVSLVGRRIDESSPMVDARLPDGSRVNAVIPPIALDGPMMSIRRFAHIPLKMDNLVNELRSLTPEMATMLEALSRAKVNMLISGGTGAGKTTLLNILSGYIPESERLVTIEDAAELQLQQAHVVRLETRPPNIEGKGEITARALVKNALRMRPDRIIIGEVRGAEAVDMLQAMNTGHEGSLTTIHANTPRDALSRLENMIGMANLNLPHKAARQQIASAITVIIQALRLTDGKRRITSIQEVTGMEGDVITMQEIFAYHQTGVDANGAIEGHFQASGVRPRFVERLQAFGITLPDRMFDPAGNIHEERTMSGNSLPIIALLVFAAVLLLFQGMAVLWRARRGAEARRLQRRLDVRSQLIASEGQRSLFKQNRLSALSSMARLLGGLSFAVRLERTLVQAGSSWTVSSLILSSAAAGVAGLLFAFFMAFPRLAAPRLHWRWLACLGSPSCGRGGGACSSSNGNCPTLWT